jgi:hypothetical protein
MEVVHRILKADGKMTMAMIIEELDKLKKNHPQELEHIDWTACIDRLPQTLEVLVREGLVETDKGTGVVFPRWWAKKV